MSPRVGTTLPTVEPILLTPRGDPFDDRAWLFEPKYDGYRGLLYVTRGSCHFRSKRGKSGHGGRARPRGSRGGATPTPRA